MKEKILEIIPQKMPYDMDSVTIFEGGNSLDYDGAIKNFRDFSSPFCMSFG